MSDKKRADFLEKISSGAEGFDDITAGGLPLRRTTLLMGGPECGKTVFALQMLVSDATRHHTPGIFVAFEEDARRVTVNAETCGWEMRGLEQKNRLDFVNTCMRSDVVKSGAFDITGMLAALEAKSQEMSANLIVFNAIDVLLNPLDHPGAGCSELYRLHEWLTRHELTGIVTTKIEADTPATAQRCGFMPFMADCAALLNQRVTDRVAVRSMRVPKYRR